jgi:hypothetical protein
VFPKDYTSSEIWVGFGEALLRLLDSLTEPVIPTSLNAACGRATSKDQGFEVSKVPRSGTLSAAATPSRKWSPPARRCLLLIFVIGAGQLLDMFPHASVNVRRDLSYLIFPGVGVEAVHAPQTRLWRYAKKLGTDRDLIRFGSPSRRSCITFLNNATRMRRRLTERKH